MADDVEAKCPECGKIIYGDGTRFECQGCPGWGVYFLDNGVLVDPQHRSRTSNRRCIGCDLPLEGELTMAWENGSNEGSFITCKRCGTDNVF